MWSHYADCHSGVCVEFEIDDKDFKKVHYSKKLTNFKLTKVFEIVFGHEFIGEDVNFSDEELLFALEPVLTKYIDWKYEKEVRCGYSASKQNEKIHSGTDKKGNQIKLLNMPKARKIYIGCKADDAFICDVKAESKDVPLVMMNMAKDKYGLVEKPLENK